MPLLSTLNPHPKDGEIQFYEEEHYYVHAATGLRFPTSMTGLLKPCFDTFDGAAIIARNYSKWRRDDTSKYHTLIRYLELVEEKDEGPIKNAIALLWQRTGTEAADKGTRMHKEIEDYMNGVLPPPSDKLPAPMGVAAYIGMTEWFYPEQKLEPWRVEFPVCLTTTLPDGTVIPVVAGLIDCLMRSKHDGRFWMLDWKRVDPKKKGLLGKKSVAHGMWKNKEMANAPFDQWEADSYHQYSAQQLGYRHMLIEGGYMKAEEFAGCFLVQMHDDLDTAHVVEVADMTDEVEQLFEASIRSVRTKYIDAHPECDIKKERAPVKTLKRPMKRATSPSLAPVRVKQEKDLNPCLSS